MKVSLTKETLATMTDDLGPLNVLGFVKKIPKPNSGNFMFVGSVILQLIIPP